MQTLSDMWWTKIIIQLLLTTFPFQPWSYGKSYLIGENSLVTCFITTTHTNKTPYGEQREDFFTVTEKPVRHSNLSQEK